MLPMQQFFSDGSMLLQVGLLLLLAFQISCEQNRCDRKCRGGCQREGWDKQCDPPCSRCAECRVHCRLERKRKVCEVMRVVRAKAEYRWKRIWTRTRGSKWIQEWQRRLIRKLDWTRTMVCAPQLYMHCYCARQDDVPIVSGWSSFECAGLDII